VVSFAVKDSRFKKLADTRVERGPTGSRRLQREKGRSFCMCHWLPLAHRGTDFCEKAIADYNWMSRGDPVMLKNGMGNEGTLFMVWLSV